MKNSPQCEGNLKVPLLRGNTNSERLTYGTRDFDQTSFSSEAMSHCYGHTPSQAQWAPPGFDRNDEANFRLDGTAEVSEEFTLTVFLSAVLAGLVTVLDNTPYGLVLFPATFQDQYSSVGVAMILSAAALGQIVFTFTSSFHCAVSCMVVENLPFLAMMGRDVVKALTEQKQEDCIIPTLIFLWAISSCLSGLAMLALGAASAGKFTAYFPRHVLLGYVGGMGAFIFLSGIEITTNREWGWDWDSLVLLAEPHVRNRLVVTFGLWGCIPLVKKVDSPAALPIFLLMIPPMFWVVVGLLGLSAADVREAEWVIAAGATPGTGGLLPLTMITPTKIAWHVVHQQVFSVFGIVIFTILHVPVNAPALGLTMGTPTNIDREFYSHGVSNLVSGLMGGLQTYLVYSTSALYYKCGGGGKKGGVIIAAVVLVFAVGGNVALNMLPRPLAGVVLIHLGFELLSEVFVDSLAAITMTEYVQVVVVVLSMEVYGFMQGLVIGLVLACAAFIIASAAENPIEVSAPGGGIRSENMRPLQLRRKLDLLQEDYVWILRLHEGSLFFGNSVRLLEHAEHVMDTHERVRFLVLHFRRLKGADCTAVQALSDLVASSRRRDIIVVFAGLPHSLYNRIEHVLDKRDEPYMQLSDNINDAFSWVEDTLLSSVAPPPLQHSEGIVGLLRPLAPDAPLHDIELLSAGFVRQVVEQDAILWRKGDHPVRAVLLAEGLLGVSSVDDKFVEFRKPGQLSGELGLLTGEPRQHMLVAISRCVLWSATLEGLSDPNALACFQRVVISCASHRLHQLTLLGHVHSV